MMQSDGLTANYHPGPMRINAASAPLIQVSLILSKLTTKSKLATDLVSPGIAKKSFLFPFCLHLV